MTQRTWLITGVSSGFGRNMTEQLLKRGDRVVGAVRKQEQVADLLAAFPENFDAELLDVTDTAAIRALVVRVFAKLGRIDVVASNAGYGLFGAAEELSDGQIDKMIATNLVGSIQLIRAVLPHLRNQGGPVASSSSRPMADRWLLRGTRSTTRPNGASRASWSWSLRRPAPFGIGMTIVEPGGARTEFRYGSAQVADPMSVDDDNPAHAFLKMLDPKNGLAAGDPARMAARIIESVDVEPGAAANDSRLTGAGEHHCDPSQADRWLRGADRAFRFHGLPAWGVNGVHETHSENDGLRGPLRSA